MKRCVVVVQIATFAVFASISFAKQAPSRDQRLVSQLDLKPDQKTKVDPILADAAEKLRAIRTDSALSQDDKKNKSAAVRKDTDEKLKAILTDAQWKNLQELRQEGKKKK